MVEKSHHVVCVVQPPVGGIGSPISFVAVVLSYGPLEPKVKATASQTTSPAMEVEKENGPAAVLSPLAEEEQS